MEQGIGISGMGRIGRLLVRKMMKDSRRNCLLAINSIYPIETVAHLLKYDSVHGIWDADILVYEGKLVINGHKIEVTLERDPVNIPWKALNVNIAIDATGKFNDRQGAQKHLAAGAKSVIITAPGKHMDLTVVMGVNDRIYDSSKHVLLSAASCTTNCAAPLLAILDHAFKVECGWMTTVHSFTSDQNHLDNPHKDLRWARACTQSIVPTTSGVEQALADVLPHLAPTIRGLSVRVPTQDVSLVDLTVKVSKEVSTTEVKDVFRKVSTDSYARYVGYIEEPLVSIDFVGREQSAVVDGLSVMSFKDQIKVLAWYDNEWAYACRVAELAAMVLERIGIEWEPTLVR